VKNCSLIVLIVASMIHNTLMPGGSTLFQGILMLVLSTITFNLLDSGLFACAYNILFCAGTLAVSDRVASVSECQ
jgi:hypothetical protein